MEYIALIGALLTLLGSLVLIISSIGLLRMPDSFLRVQVGTKASTAGVGLVMMGLALVIPAWFGKLFIITLFVMMTNPVSSNVLMRAAHRIGHPMSPLTVTDQLKEDEKATSGNGDL
jgi:multicomponent Na+:H+ antiporter subunit G